MLNELKEVYRTVGEGKEAALTFTMNGEEYRRSFRPPERLILLGCGNIGQELCRRPGLHRDGGGRAPRLCQPDPDARRCGDPLQ